MADTNKIANFLVMENASLYQISKKKKKISIITFISSKTNHEIARREIARRLRNYKKEKIVIKPIKNFSAEKKEIFDSIITQSYKWLKIQVSKYIPRYYIDDSVQNAIMNFYQYHFKYFNLEYDTDYVSKYRRAKCYFLNRFFWYLSKKCFYGKKLRQEIKIDIDLNDEAVSRKDNLFYSNKVSDESKTSVDDSCLIKKYAIQMANDINENFGFENNIYISQFTQFIKDREMKKMIKKKILLYLKTLNTMVFGTNVSFYMNKIKKLNTEFNS